MDYIGHVIALIPGAVALYLMIAQRRNEEAEETQKLTAVAMSLIEPLKAKVNRLEQELAVERALRQADALEAAVQGRVLTAAIQYINELTAIMQENGLKVPEKPVEIEAWLRKRTSSGKSGDGGG